MSMYEKKMIITKWLSLDSKDFGTSPKPTALYFVHNEYKNQNSTNFVVKEIKESVNL